MVGKCLAENRDCVNGNDSTKTKTMLSRGNQVAIINYRGNHYVDYI